MSRVLTDSLTHAYTKCENGHLCSINNHFFKTKDFCFINQNQLDNLRYQLVFTKFLVFLWVANFWGLTTDFACLPTLLRTFITGYICLTKNIAIPNTHIFHFLFLLCDRETHFGCCLILLSPPLNTKHSIDPPCTHNIASNTKHSVDFPTMHSHSFNAMSSCICNARWHCMLYHVTYIMNATRKTQSTPLTGVMDNHITCI